MKVTTAPHPAATITPTSRRRVGIHVPPERPSARTRAVDAAAPAKAAPGMLMPAAPARIAPSAPTAAPPEMPRTYGSASGLRTSTCMSTPASARSPPVANASSARGSRSVRTISASSAPAGARSASRTFSGGIATLPTTSAIATLAIASSASAASRTACRVPIMPIKRAASPDARPDRDDGEERRLTHLDAGAETVPGHAPETASEKRPPQRDHERRCGEQREEPRRRGEEDDRPSDEARAARSPSEALGAPGSERRQGLRPDHRAEARPGDNQRERGDRHGELERERCQDARDPRSADRLREWRELSRDDREQHELGREDQHDRNHTEGADVGVPQHLEQTPRIAMGRAERVGEVCEPVEVQRAGDPYPDHHSPKRADPRIDEDADDQRRRDDPADQGADEREPDRRLRQILGLQRVDTRRGDAGQELQREEEAAHRQTAKLRASRREGSPSASDRRQVAAGGNATRPRLVVGSARLSATSVWMTPAWVMSSTWPRCSRVQHEKAARTRAANSVYGSPPGGATLPGSLRNAANRAGSRARASSVSSSSQSPKRISANAATTASGSWRAAATLSANARQRASGEVAMAPIGGLSIAASARRICAQPSSLSGGSDAPRNTFGRPATAPWRSRVTSNGSFTRAPRRPPRRTSPSRRGA